jgi:hypothetical protein
MISPQTLIMWGIETGCNGKIKNFLEPIRWDTIPPNHEEPVLPEIELLLEQGKTVIVARCVDENVYSGTAMPYSDKSAGAIEKYFHQPII